MNGLNDLIFVDFVLYTIQSNKISLCGWKVVDFARGFLIPIYQINEIWRSALKSSTACLYELVMFQFVPKRFYERKKKQFLI